MKNAYISRFWMMAAMIVVFAGCDVIDGPKRCLECIAENAGQKVLLEDWTGHTCGNCPRGHEKSAELHDLYGDNVVIIGIHAEFFADPKPPKYPADFRTENGAIWADDFSPNYPSGMINRRAFAGDVVHPVADWGTHVGTAIAETPSISMELVAEPGEATDDISVQIVLDYLDAHSTDDQIVVVLTEDSIISPQTDYSMSPEDLLDYVQMHVYRGSVTPGAYGVSIKDGATIDAGEHFELSYSFTLDPAWNPAHLNVIAYVMDGDSKEVWQVDEVHLSE